MKILLEIIISYNKNMLCDYIFLILNFVHLCFLYFFIQYSEYILSLDFIIYLIITIYKIIYFISILTFVYELTIVSNLGR